MFARLHKHRMKFLILLGVFSILILDWQYWAWREAKELEGIYLAKGGRTVFVVEKDVFNIPHVSRGQITTSTSVYPNSVPESVGFRLLEGRLQISQEVRNDGSRGQDFGARLSLSLQRSDSDPGDWDLVGGEHEIFLEARSAPRMLDAILPSPLVRSFPVFRQRELMFAAEFPKQATPLRSFLHSFDDARILDYFRLCRMNADSPPILQSIREVSSDHPEDPYIALHRIDAEARMGEVEIAESLIDEWGDLLQSAKDPLLRDSFALVMKSVWKARGDPRGDDLRDILAALVDPSADLRLRKDRLKARISHPILPTMTVPLVEPEGQALRELLTPPGFVVDLVVMARVFRVLATLDLFRGDRVECLEILSGLYHHGMMLNADGPAAGRQVGISLRRMAREGLEEFFMNATETPDQLSLFKTEVENLEAKTGKQDPSKMYQSLHLPPVSMMSPEGRFGWEYEQLAEETREEDVRFQLLRMGVAAKEFHYRTGSFPASASDFAPLFPHGPPPDPYSGNPLLFLVGDTDERFIVYSVGPDREDHAATMFYDRSRHSQGDVVLEIDLDRRYPFDPKGTRARNADELISQFPNGLPTDIFSESGNEEALSIFDASENSPLLIFSFGPSVKNRSAFQPSNGYSRTFPNLDSRRSLRGFSRFRELGPRRVQRIFSSSEMAAGSEGQTFFWTPTVFYNPTNGTMSAGEIAIEVPPE